MVLYYGDTQSNHIHEWFILTRLSMKIGWVISIFLLDGSVLSVIYSNSLFDVPQVYDIYKYGVYIYMIYSYLDGS